MKTTDGYIRVSRVAGRGGESFISPVEQRDAIEAWAKATGTEILEWHTDLDKSGGTDDRAGFNDGLERCRAGLTGGIVAAKLDRLTRTGVVGIARLLDDAGKHGYNVVGIDLGVDLRTPNGKLVANLLGSVAQWELERRRDDWAAAQRNAIARGVPNGRAPVGYYRTRNEKGDLVGPLLIDEPAAAKVRAAFRERAAGEPFAQIGRRHGWGHSTTRQILCNEAYLGVARSGANVNPEAHEPIVTRELFEAANAARTKQPIPPGDTTRDLLLVGLARCGGCGHTLKVTRRPRVDGSYVVSYYCKDAATVPCEDRAYVHADALDGFVADWFKEALKTAPRMIDVVAAARELEEAQDEQASAEAQLVAFVEAASALDAGLFQRGIDARQARVDAARSRVRELSARVTRIPAGGALVDLWAGFDAAERRDVLAGFLDRVEVTLGASRDLAGNVSVRWADGTLAEIAEDEEGVRVAAA